MGCSNSHVLSATNLRSSRKSPFASLLRLDLALSHGTSEQIPVDPGEPALTATQLQPFYRRDKAIPIVKKSDMADGPSLGVSCTPSHDHPESLIPSRFILLRYSGLLATLPSLFLTSVPSGYCQFACGLSQAGTILVVASSGTIFVFRVTALWGNNRIVSAIVGAAFFVMVGCWVCLLRSYSFNPSDAITDSSCYPIPSYRWRTRICWLQLRNAAYRFCTAQLLVLRRVLCRDPPFNDFQAQHISCRAF